MKENPSEGIFYIDSLGNDHLLKPEQVRAYGYAWNNNSEYIHYISSTTLGRGQYDSSIPNIFLQRIIPGRIQVLARQINKSAENGKRHISYDIYLWSRQLNSPPRLLVPTEKDNKNRYSKTDIVAFMTEWTQKDFSKIPENADIREMLYWINRYNASFSNDH